MILPIHALGRSAKPPKKADAKATSQPSDGSDDKQTDDDGQFTYDVSHGYPKGIPGGVRLKVKTGNGFRIIHGVPYEEMNDKLQHDLDEHPLDDAGQIRVFIPDSYLGEGNFIELGSDEHARRFMQSLIDNGKRLL